MTEASMNQINSMKLADNNRAYWIKILEAEPPSVNLCCLSLLDPGRCLLFLNLIKASRSLHQKTKNKKGVFLLPM